MKVALKLFGLILAVILFFTTIGAATGTLNYAIRWVTAPFIGALDKRETVTSGDYQIFSYEHFYDLCAAIQRKQRSLMAQKDLLDDVEDKRRVYQNIAALRSQIQSDVSSYNADSRKSETMARYKDRGLPVRINYQEKEIITCE